MEILKYGIDSEEKENFLDFKFRFSTCARETLRSAERSARANFHPRLWIKA